MILFVGFLLMEIVMPQISRTALVPYSAEQMYQLVNDVQSYPQFLPGCTGSRILESTPGQMTAAVDVSKAQEIDWWMEVYAAEPGGVSYRVSSRL